MRAPLLWLCGSSGVGKSAVAWEMFTRLTQAGIATGYLDTDQIGQCYPPAPEDPGNDRLMAANVAAMWPNYRAEGARCLIVSGCIDTPTLVPVYTGIPGTRLTLCRLRADREVLRSRFLRRGRYPDLIEAVLQEADALDHSDFVPVCIDTTALTVSDVADAITRLTRWPGLR
ncbi:MAG: adenylyl-sulfate kinase [Mycobacterium sp.]|nr:adenylyl-sulfate kinase [Mycobacterium sp.]